MRLFRLASLSLILAVGCGDDGGSSDNDARPGSDGGNGGIDARPGADAAEPTCTPATGTTVTTELVASGLTAPGLVTAPQGDARLFIIEQVGRIRIVRDGELLSTPFLDVRSLTHHEGERGLLGLAFHPNYASNGRFFVNYTRTGDNATIIGEYTVSNDPDVANTTEKKVMVIPQDYANHNGGMIEFGPDGYLWIGMGDGGSGGDPLDRAEDATQLLGKMLRIDVDGGDPYAIPSGNPFAGSANGEEDPRPEIWALGLRNPWRFSFDPANGDVYIADVGQGAREEVNIEAATAAGLDYGWDIWEGNRCNEPPPQFQVCPEEGYTFPAHEYNHSGGRCSVTGGYVYRGTCMPDLDGWYFFADYCTGEYWRLQYVNGQVAAVEDISDEIDVPRPSSFGRDSVGEVYVSSLMNGSVYRIVIAP